MEEFLFQLIFMALFSICFFGLYFLLSLFGLPQNINLFIQFVIEGILATCILIEWVEKDD